MRYSQTDLVREDRHNPLRMGLLPYIPSPSSGVVHLGPLTIHLYGLTLLVAILACVWLTTVRWKKAGGDADLVVRVTVWGVAAVSLGRVSITT